MSKKEYLTVEELNFFINNLFNEETLLHNVPVVGEVSGCSVVAGHCYFTLKDKKAQIKVCFFNCPPKLVPSNGESVLVNGVVDYYVKNGQLRLRAYDIKPFGKGQLYVALEELKERLTKEGYFNESNKKEIPAFCERVAIITSSQGAALQDFISTVRKRNCLLDISVIDVRVQGENCVKDVLEALINADDYGFDAIILARGGGSFEDLYSFNDEKLVKTIFAMKTPIISAIGHETDYTLCDFVADYRAITPTAAAEKIAYDIVKLKKSINNIVINMRNLTKNKYIRTTQKLVNQLNILQGNTNLLLSQQYGKIKNSLNLMKLYQQYNYDTKSRKIQDIIARIDAVSPTKLLNNGYFRILKQGNVVFDGTKIEINDEICIVGASTKITALVKYVEVK